MPTQKPWTWVWTPNVGICFTHETKTPYICTSSTLIGGNGGAGLGSLHTTLEGPTEYVNAIRM